MLLLRLKEKSYAADLYPVLFMILIQSRQLSLHFAFESLCGVFHGQINGHALSIMHRTSHIYFLHSSHMNIRIGWIENTIRIIFPNPCMQCP